MLENLSRVMLCEEARADCSELSNMLSFEGPASMDSVASGNIMRLLGGSTKSMS